MQQADYHYASSTLIESRFNQLSGYPSSLYAAVKKQTDVLEPSKHLSTQALAHGPGKVFKWLITAFITGSSASWINQWPTSSSTSL